MRISCLLSCLDHLRPGRYRSSVGHDVTRLGAAAVKRRYPPGMVPGQEMEEITLVQSDIEGSTEIWEWYHTLLPALLCHYSTQHQVQLYQSAA